MIHLNVFVLNGLLTFEFFVLICAGMFWAYTSKNNLGKWFRYSAISIAVIMKLIILCTIVNAFMFACGGHGYGRMGMNGGCCSKEMMCGHGMGCGMHGMKGDMKDMKMCPHHQEEENEEHEEMMKSDTTK